MFDETTEISLIERVVAHNPSWLKYMPDRPEVRMLCIKCMEQDFSVAEYIPEQVKVSDEILNYQKSKGKLSFLEKYFDCDEKNFKVKVKVLYGHHCTKYDDSKMIEDKYDVTAKFNDFNRFYDFLDGDLYDAELRDYDFSEVNLKKYNIEGAVIDSDVLQLQGLYDGSYFSFIKKRMDHEADEIIAKNEIILKEDLCYLKLVDDEMYERNDNSRIPFFYISDIHLAHQICNKFGDRATKEEIRSYIRQLVKKMVDSIGSRPDDSHLLIAGDTSSIFELASIFYKELVKCWSPEKIIVVSGNHELWDPWFDMEDNIEIYRNFFDSIGVTFLQNDLLYVEDGNRYKIIREKEMLKMGEEEIRQRVQCSTIIVLGGIGFSGLNNEFNASRIRFGKSFDMLSREEALQKDIQEAKRFNLIYTKCSRALCQNRVIVLTHIQKEDWNAENHNAHWIYVNGHNHRNFYEASEVHTIYADNQIGYRTQNIGLKYFWLNNDYDTFAYCQDGIYEITKEQYIDFYRGKKIDAISFNREDGVIYMIKRNNVYMFVIYCLFSKNSTYKSLYLLEGGKLKSLARNRLDDLEYYYDNLKKYSEQVSRFLRKYLEGQRRIAKFVKSFGGAGRIHGSIIDIDYYCHLFVNPTDGKITPYWAFDTSSRYVCKDFETLLQNRIGYYERKTDSNKFMLNSYKNMLKRYKLTADKYLKYGKESMKDLLEVQYSCQPEEFRGKDVMWDNEGYIYKISGIIKSLQYCTDKNIVRLWNEELLNYNFINCIVQAD